MLLHVTRYEIILFKAYLKPIITLMAKIKMNVELLNSLSLET